MERARVCRLLGSVLARRLSTTASRGLIQKGGKKVLRLIGVGMGNRQDPTFWTFDVDMKDERRSFYREAAVDGWETIAWSRFFGTVIVAYVVYQFYWRSPMMLGGHFALPDPSEFTDSELGIPPDSAADPEYWGDQQPKGYGA